VTFVLLDVLTKSVAFGDIFIQQIFVIMYS